MPGCAYESPECEGLVFRSATGARWHSSCAPGRAVSWANKIAKQLDIPDLDIRSSLWRTASMTDSALSLLSGVGTGSSLSRPALERLAAARLLWRALETDIGPAPDDVRAPLITALAAVLGAYDDGGLVLGAPTEAPSVGPAVSAIQLASLELRVRGEIDQHAQQALPGILFDLGLATSAHEAFWVIPYDIQGGIRSVVEVARGSFNEVNISIPVVMTAVLTVGADFFAVAHNHPGGDTNPSVADVQLTQSITEAAATVGLYFQDHWIVGPKGNAFSFARRGMMTPAEPEGHDAADLP